MLDLLLLPFFQRALIVGLILGFLMAILGVFVVLRKMSFFSDAIGHSALTGIALGILLGINPFVTAFVFALLVAGGVAVIRRISRQEFDTLLGVFFSAAVALGVTLVSLNPGYQASLVSFLFGNILTVSGVDIISSTILAVVIIVWLIFFGKALTAITFDQTLARAEGVAVDRHELVFLLMLAAAIALTIKFVGVILVTALVIIPAATAQNIARSFVGMFAWSITISLLAVLVGMIGSALLNLPSGPAIVLVGAILYGASLLLKKTVSL